MKTKKPRAKPINLTLSPETKDWVERYVRDNPRYGSVSALVRTLLDDERRAAESPRDDRLMELLTAAAKTYRRR